MRKVIPFNENWSFRKEDTGLPLTLPADWETVTLPHTWNAVDGQDGKGSYYRGACWYAKEFPTPSGLCDSRLYVEVLAASLSGRVFVNGKEAAYHEGGFSSFTADITDYLHPEGSGKANLIAIAADNSDRPHIYPRMADFTFYGGLYRGVNLIVVPRVHFDLEYWGAPGLSVTSQPDGESAFLKLQSWVKNADADYTVCYTITDAQGKKTAECWRPAENPGTSIFLPKAHLWQGVEDPYLYTCTAALVYRNETVDEISCRFGIRSFAVDPEKGFFLNGKPMMLRGVSRHQDRLYKGNALTRQEHYEDAALIHELGANTVRLAHYQHSRDFYDACDEYGFIVWAEIPYISSQSDDPKAHENCRTQMQELVYQNYNHPSICFWGISNEITIAGEKPGLVENHKDLNALVKEIDPTRLTTMAHVSMVPLDSRLHGITDLESYNHYFGWYGGKYTDNEKWLDNFHEKHPEICLGLSEYGAEGIITYQPDEPKCRDYSESYQAEYHEHMAEILMARPYLWSTHVWNMFDFGCAARNEGGTAGRNNKGLVTLDRKIKKEAFYLYKAYWSREPFVHMCGRRYAQRPGDADRLDGKTPAENKKGNGNGVPEASIAGGSTRVKVYSNQPEVSLYVNGELYQTLKCDKVFLFEQVPLFDGFTCLTACAGECSDTMTLEKVETKPEIYTLPAEEDEDDMEGAPNWFDEAAAVDANAAMEFPEGFFSIKDTVKEVLDQEDAAAVLAGALYAMTGMKLKKSMMGMMGEKSVEGLMEMMTGMGMGDNVPENALQVVNVELNKVKKK